CLVLLENRAQLVDEELHVVEHRVFGGGEIRHPFHDGLVVDLHLRQRLVQRVHAGAEPVALGLQRRPALLQRFELVAHLAGLLNQLAILGDRVDDSFDAGRHGSTSAMPSRSPRLFTHSVGGGGDVTHSTSMANVALSWPMTAAMTNAHVLRRPCFARAPQTSRLPRIRRDSARFVARRKIWRALCLRSTPCAFNVAVLRPCRKPRRPSSAKAPRSSEPATSMAASSSAGG